MSANRPTGKDVINSKFEDAVDKVIANMEEFDLSWVRSWSCGSLKAPMNESTQKNYRGINFLLLWLNSVENGYRSNRYLTYRQARKLGGNVKKGENGTPVFFFSMIEKQSSKDQNLPENEKEFYPMMKCFTVFNIDQIEGIEFEHKKIETFQNERDEKIEDWLKSVDVDIEFEGFQPCFIPGSNKVKMPKIEFFRDSDNYYSTLFHELAHSSGHESRLNRDMSDYAFEELVAELTSLFVCSEFDVEVEVCQHTEYLASWLKDLKNDKMMLWKAASKAQKAFDYLIG